MTNDNQYSFEAIFDIDETRALFREFLVSEKNVEPLLFIEQVELYSLKKSNLARFEFAGKIVKEFIERGCTYEINVSGEIKNRTMKLFERSNDAECPASLFETMHGQILLELKIDCFPRFVKSQFFEQFVAQKETKDAQFLRRIQTKRKSGGSQWDQLLNSSNSTLANDIKSSSYMSVNNNNFLSSLQPSSLLNGSALDLATMDDAGSDASSVVSAHTSQFFQPSDLASNEDSSMELSLISPVSTPEQIHSNIVKAMSKPYTGIPLRDHKLGLFKTYPNCFTGAKMISWVRANFTMTNDEVVKCCNEIVASGQVTPANNRKKPEVYKQFSDTETQLYKFAFKKTVAIVGAGFAGMHLYQLIRQQFDVTLFDEKPNFEYNLDHNILVGDPTQANQMSLPYKKLIRQAKIIQQRVLSITPYGIYLDNEKHVEERLLPFDYIVVSTGSSSWVPFPIDEDSQSCCMYPYQSKSILEKFTKLRDAKTICVIGGGPVGLEVTGELCSVYKGAQVVLVSQQNTFLERTCPKAHTMIAKILAKFPNLKQMTSQRAIEIKNRTMYHKVVTEKEDEQTTMEQLKADVFVVCVGTAPRTQILQEHFSHALTAKGFVKVNERFQIPRTNEDGAFHQNIFAIGDICAINEEKLAQTARVHAQKLAKNLRLIERSEDEKKLESYAPEPQLQLISLGKANSITIIGDKVSDGGLSAKMKNLVRTKIMNEIKS